MIAGIGIGTEVANYRVIGLIGQGGMSVVYRAEDTATGESAALKVLMPELATDAAFRKRFLREWRYASSLQHPNIVPVRDVGEADALVYLAMRLVLGTDLRGLLALEGALDAERAVAILAQVAGALDAVHAGGVLHRDVKPGNVLVASGEGPEPPGHSYLTDFGLSKNPSQDSVALTAVGEFVGSHHYTAPEQILGKPLDQRADVYSLGCVLYESLTGAPPFLDLADAEVLHAHIERPPPSVTEQRAGLPAAIDEVVAKAMAKRPEDRYDSCTAAMQAAEAALTGAPPPAPAAPAPVAGGAPAPAPAPGGGLGLEVTAGNALGTEIEVVEELVIGRHAPAEGKLADDIEISRQHARIARTPDGAYTIVDLGSRNGTFVNGRQIGGAEALSVGDSIDVGGTTLVVRADGRPAASATAASAVVATPAAPPRLSLRLEVDLESGEAVIELDEASEPVRLVHEDGRWRLSPPA